MAGHESMIDHPTRSACSILFEQGQTVEVRLIGKRGTASGFYNTYDRLSLDAVMFDNRGEYAGTYVTLNPVNPDLLARRANRIETRLGKDEKSAGDSDILCRRWLPVDIDPVRPSGVSSSDSEHAAAIKKASRVAAYLTELGWSQPVVADSGNGAHLLYRIDCPNDAVSRDLVRGVLETLHILFSDESSTIDTSVFNAARIWKLYGTTSRKGDNIAARPHRKAAILSVPEVVKVVTGEQLADVAGMFPNEAETPECTSRESRGAIDLAAWLDRYGIGYRQKPYAGGSIFVLTRCPFSSDHTDGSYAIQFPNGAIFAGCHHASCGGGRQRWQDLRAMFEGPVPSRSRQQQESDRRSRNSSSTVHDLKSGQSSGACEQDTSPTVSDEVSGTALSVLNDGDPLSYMLETFALDHIGDPVVAECLVMSLASRKVINARGLHVSVTGESGKGKSHAFETMMSQVPEEFRLEGRMSEKALFYIKGMQPGSVIALDDVSLSDQMQEILKGVTTSFRRPFTYRTVSKDRVGETCVIPERCVWWVAKVDGTGDDQVWNRMLTCWIDDSEEQDAAVLKRTLQDASGFKPEKTDIRNEALACQEIWRQISPAWVVIPFAERIRFSSAINRRNPDMLLDLVRSHAVLNQHQRVHADADGMVQILATEDDFSAAQRLYMALNSSSGSLESKLTRREATLVDAIRSHGTGEITIAELQHITDLSNSVIYKMMHGSSSRGREYSGLLEKCPAVSVCDRTLVVDESGTTSAHRRSKAYSWDERIYESWCFEGGCWLDKDGHDDESPDRSGDQRDCGIAERCGSSAEGAATDSGSQCGSYQVLNNNNIILCTYCGIRENTQDDDCDQRCDHDSSSEIRCAATSDQDHESEPGKSSDLNNEADNPCPDFRNDAADAHSEPRSVSGSAAPGSSGSGFWKVRSSDFCEIDRGFGAGPCDCCGSEWVQYQERMTRERLSAPPRRNRKICRSCYEHARLEEAASVRALPGVVDAGSMTRLTSDIGRCQVCGTFKATWHDPGSRTAVCDSCRSRILREGS
nr:hypothetical protein [uncultured Methanospirillum sp.]